MRPYDPSAHGVLEGWWVATAKSHDPCTAFNFVMLVPFDTGFYP